MIDEIRSLLIKGKCFQEETKLSLYIKDDERLTLIYGRNGSGKSTLSKGIYSASHNTSEPDLVAALLDKNENNIDFSNADNVFVFNEDYIDKNIKINDDSLGAIVLLGEQAELQSEIDKYQESLKEIEKVIENMSGEYEQYNDEKNILSPQYHMNIIEKSLRKAGGWAETDANIKGHKHNTSVTEQVKREFLQLSPTKKEAELRTEYKEKLNLFSRVSTPDNEYPNKICKVNVEANIDNHICSILAKKIEKTELTDREQQIFAVVTSGRQRYVEAAHKEFEDSKVEFCPYCYQAVSEEYKNELIKSIDRVLNKEVEIHKQELCNIIFPDLRNNYDYYFSLDKELTTAIIKQKEVCENIIEQYKKHINEKSNNIYQSIDNVNYNLEQKIIVLNELLEKLEAKCVSFNNAIKNKNQLKNELIEINKDIAYFDIKQAIQDYKKQVAESELKNTELRKKEEDKKEIEKKLINLKQRQSQKGLATKSINNALNYVFYSSNRLSIEFKNDKYYLKSNGRNVKPKDISTGERNILALCYFLTEIVSNQEISKLYNKEMFVVIDDPISSFDFENKVGIASLLRRSINTIISGNEKSKVLVLSHDLTTVFDIYKALKEIWDSKKGIANYPLCSPRLVQLNNGELCLLKIRHNEYSDNLTKIYNFINDQNNIDSLVIGNIMRRVLEAFSTFTYQKSIDKVSYNPIVTQALGKYAAYFENRMYRLVLNGESHFEEQIYNLDRRSDFFDFISDEEKKDTAKDILCFMHILNPGHIEAHLPGAVQDIISWEDKIAQNDFLEIYNKNGKEKSKQPTTEIVKRIIKLYDLPLSAGIGNDILEDDMSSEDYYTDNKICDFALRIEGDSMKPKIPNGSIVLIKKCDDIESGKIGAFFYNGSVFCKKKICREDGTKWLVSLNKDYNDFKISEGDIVKVYGEVVEVVQ